MEIVLSTCLLLFVTAKAETSLWRLAAARAAANRQSEGAAANRPAGRLTARTHKAGPAVPSFGRL